MPKKKGAKKGANKTKSNTKKSNSLKLYAVLSIAIIGLAAITGAIAIIIATAGNDGGGGSGGSGPAWDTLSPEAQKRWLNYEGEVEDDGVWINDDSIFLNLSDKDSLEEMAQLEGSKNFSNSGEDERWYGEDDMESGGAFDDDDMDGDINDAPKPASDEKTQDPDIDRDDREDLDREIEEADIVKVEGDLMYVLNAYKGLIIVDLSDPDDPEVMGRASVLGTPIEMYIVDFLAFIIVNKDYNYWYDYWLMEGDGAKMAPGVASQQSIGSQIKVVNLNDLTNPKVVKSFDLHGFSVDSRRVGEVLYVVTNTYSWWGYEGYLEQNDMTYVSSIIFSDPDNVGMVEEAKFTGSSNNIHVSKEAIYVAQAMYQYNNNWDDDDVDIEDGISADEEERAPSEEVSGHDYWTRVTYVDIYDPNGDLTVRDYFDVPGNLENRYQMDEYDDHFRIVNHFRGNWGDQGSSTLTIYDVQKPDNIKKTGELEIDDAGTLMATRFAEDRGYTIHLPRTVDPLDVLDLSDPTDPKLCDILEIPGWVEHMEVRGRNIIAIGVDDTDGYQKVAVTLFDVNDPYKAIVKERLIIGGEGHTWSAANFDDKRLSVVDEFGLILVPYSSNDYSSGQYKTTHGVQIIGFDLKKGDLTMHGSAQTPMQVSRTRVVNGRIIASSDTHLITIDASVLAAPKITSELEFAVNVIDTYKVGNYLIEYVSQYGQDHYLRVVPFDEPESSKPRAVYDLGSHYGVAMFNEPYLYFIGMDYKESAKQYGYSLKILDLSQPLEAKFRGTYNFENDDTPNIWGTSLYTADKFVFLTDSGQVAVITNDYNWDYENKMRTNELLLIDVKNPDDPGLMSSTQFKTSGYPSSVLHKGNMIYVTDTEYIGYVEDDGYYHSESKYWTSRILISDPTDPVVMARINVPGILVGVDNTGTMAYSISEWWDDVDYKVYTTFNTLSLDENAATIEAALKFDEGVNKIVIVRNTAYITFGYNYYGGGYYYDDVALEGRGTRASGGNTKMMIISLIDHKNPQLAWTLNIPGTASLAKEEDGFLFFRMGSSEGVLIYDVRAGGTPALLGFYVTPGYTTEMDVHGNDIYLLHGFQGITHVDITSRQMV